MEKIYLNPKLCLESIEHEGIRVSIDNNRFNLNGPKLKKIFIENFIFFISPIIIEELYRMLKLKDPSILEEDFYEVITLLHSRSILLSVTKQTKPIKKKLEILIIDYTMLGMELFTAQFNSAFDETGIQFGLAYLSNCSIPELDKVDLKKYDVILPIIGAFYELHIELFLKLFSRRTLILPVVANDNYFSIGPQIFSDFSLQECVNFMQNEKPRYSYINYENNHSSNILLVSTIVTELIEVVKVLRTFDKSKSKTIGKMLIHNYNSGNFENKKFKYICIDKQILQGERNGKI